MALLGVGDGDATREGRRSLKESSVFEAAM